MLAVVLTAGATFIFTKRAWSRTAAQDAARWQATLTSAHAELATLRLAHDTAISERARLAGELDAVRSSAADNETTIAGIASAIGERVLAAHHRDLAATAQTLDARATAQAASLQQQYTTESAHQVAKVDEKFRPVTDRLLELSQAVQALRVDRSAERASLETMLQRQVEEQLATRRETAKLSRALQSPTVRGFWGERSLDRVLECAGMVEGQDFHRQETLMSDDGAARPDVIVRLPGQRDVIIDSKVPLEALLAASNAVEPEQRKALFVQHARQVRAHIDRLAAANYPRKAAGSALSTAVLLFLPAEPMLERALRADGGLLEYGATRRVFLVTPSTLLIVLQTVAHIWQQEHLAEHAERIRALGAELYDRIGSLALHFATMRRAVVMLLKSFNGASGCLDRRVLSTARKIKALGAGGHKAIPTPLPIEADLRVMTATELRVEHDTTTDAACANHPRAA